MEQPPRKAWFSFQKRQLQNRWFTTLTQCSHVLVEDAREGRLVTDVGRFSACWEFHALGIEITDFESLPMLLW